MAEFSPVPKPRRLSRQEKIAQQVAKQRERQKDRKPVKRRNEERQEREFPRKYHSLERVAFVKSLGCIVPRCRDRNIENAHVIADEDKGVGRKSGYRTIAPLCIGHHRDRADSLHVLGPVAFEELHGVNLADAAKHVEMWWLDYAGERE